MAEEKRVKVIGAVSAKQADSRRALIPRGEYHLVEIPAPPIEGKANELTMIGNNQLPICRLRSDDGVEYELPFEDYAAYAAGGAVKDL